jgi:hypothetical protein
MLEVLIIHRKYAEVRRVPRKCAKMSLSFCLFNFADITCTFLNLNNAELYISEKLE